MLEFFHAKYPLRRSSNWATKRLENKIHSFLVNLQNFCFFIIISSNNFFPWARDSSPFTERNTRIVAFIIDINFSEPLEVLSCDDDEAEVETVAKARDDDKYLDYS